MNMSAEIFEALAALPDRTPEQRTADERSAAILGGAEEDRRQVRECWCYCHEGEA